MYRAPFTFVLYCLVLMGLYLWQSNFSQSAITSFVSMVKPGPHIHSQPMLDLAPASIRIEPFICLIQFQSLPHAGSGTSSFGMHSFTLIHCACWIWHQHSNDSNSRKACKIMRSTFFFLCWLPGFCLRTLSITSRLSGFKLLLIHLDLSAFEVPLAHVDFVIL